MKHWVSGGALLISRAELRQSQRSDSSPDVNELVRLRDQTGLYNVRGIDQENGTVHVLRNIPSHPIEQDVPFEAICRLNEEMAHVIACFLNCKQTSNDGRSSAIESDPSESPPTLS